MTPQTPRNRFGVSLRASAHPFSDFRKRRLRPDTAVTAFIACRAPYVEVLLVQPKHKFGRFQVDSVDVQIVSVFDLRAMQFAATNEQVDEAVEVWELRLLHSGNQLFGACH